MKTSEPQSGGGGEAAGKTQAEITTEKYGLEAGLYQVSQWEQGARVSRTRASTTRGSFLLGEAARAAVAHTCIHTHHAPCPPPLMTGADQQARGARGRRRCCRAAREPHSPGQAAAGPVWQRLPADQHLVCDRVIRSLLRGRERRWVLRGVRRWAQLATAQPVALVAQHIAAADLTPLVCSRCLMPACPSAACLQAWTWPACLRASA